MYCQKCRQPLKLDASLDDLNPAAYDLLVCKAALLFFHRSLLTLPASTSPQTQVKSTNSAKPASQDRTRKPHYDKAAQNAGQPTFKRQHANPRDAAMSFIYLTESQVGNPQQAPPASPKLPRSDSKNSKSQALPKGDEMQRVNRLFEILSSRSDIDHPVCVDCADVLVDGFQKRLETVSKERDAYVKHLRHVQANQPTQDDIKAQQEATKKAEGDKAQAMKELQKLEEEKDRLDAEILELEEESKKLDIEEDDFWRERNAFATKMADFQSERDSVSVKYSNDSQLLEKLQRSNVYNDTFNISHDGSFATINGLRLGRLQKNMVEWTEINAAWGHALLLIVTVAEKLNYKFQGYDPQPMGSTSKIIRYETPSPASSRLGSRAVQPPPKKHTLELFSSGDMPLGLTLWHRKFDNAMVAFLELVRQLGVHVERETQATGNILTLPYSIDGDKIADISIKLGIAQDDGWTKACKLTLTCCKFLLAHASNVSSGVRGSA